MLSRSLVILATFLPQVLDVAMKGEMVLGAFRNLVVAPQLHRLAGTSGCAWVLGDLDHGPALVDKSPKPFELGIVAPTGHRPPFL